jgi:ADP-heptose:LPS heptosyltransferase
MLSQPTVAIELEVHKIAVLRANALGDFIFALPAIDALRAAYPQAEIALLARRWHQTFLAHRPGSIDRVVVIPDGGIGQESDTSQDPLELEQFFAAMSREQFDMAIQMHGGGRNSNPFVQRLEARLTVGLRSPDAIALDRSMPYIYYQPEILRYLELVSLVGATPVTLEPRLMVTNTDLLEAQKAIPLLTTNSSETPIVVLHPGASDSRRWWPTDKFAAVGDALATAGAYVAVTGTPSEHELVEAVVNQMHAKAHNLCGQLSINGLAGLLSQSRVIVSNDSGPLHLAAAVGTATVGIYWCGNLITAGPLSRTRHRPAVSWRLHCPVCGIDCTQSGCNHRASFVADVPTQEVIESALSLLNEGVTRDR